MGTLAELEPEGRRQRKFKAPVKMVLKKSQVPVFFEEFEDDPPESSRLVDEGLKPLKIIRKFDQIEISPESQSFRDMLRSHSLKPGTRSK